MRTYNTLSQNIRNAPSRVYCRSSKQCGRFVHLKPPLFQDQLREHVFKEMLKRGWKPNIEGGWRCPRCDAGGAGQ